MNFREISIIICAGLLIGMGIFQTFNQQFILGPAMIISGITLSCCSWTFVNNKDE